MVVALVALIVVVAVLLVVAVGQGVAIGDLGDQNNFRRDSLFRAFERIEALEETSSHRGAGGYTNQEIDCGLQALEQMIHSRTGSLRLDLARLAGKHDRLVDTVADRVRKFNANFREIERHAGWKIHPDVQVAIDIVQLGDIYGLVPADLQKLRADAIKLLQEVVADPHAEPEFLNPFEENRAHAVSAVEELIARLTQQSNQVTLNPPAAGCGDVACEPEAPNEDYAPPVAAEAACDDGSEPESLDHVAPCVDEQDLG